jgi:HipA-like kinase
MLRAIEQIRRMRGGAHSHLLRCSDGHYYAVKFQNNPQHRRVLVNELLGTRLASRLGLPTAPLEIVEVLPELIRLTADLCVELPRSRTPCVPGLQFGSRYPGDPMRLDYGYRRNGTRGFVQALSVSRAPADAKLLAYTVEHILKKTHSAEFTVVTGVHLLAENERHRFVQETMREAGVEIVPMEAFAVWTAKIRPTIQ